MHRRAHARGPGRTIRRVRERQERLVERKLQLFASVILQRSLLPWQVDVLGWLQKWRVR